MWIFPGFLLMILSQLHSCAFLSPRSCDQSPSYGCSAKVTKEGGNSLSFFKVIQKHARNLCLIGAGAASFWWGWERVGVGGNAGRMKRAPRQLGVTHGVKGLWVQAEAGRWMGMSVCRNGIYLRSARYARWSARCRWSRSGKYLLWRRWRRWGVSLCKD